jgi:hypothetical protein
MRESKRHNIQLSPATEEFLDGISPFAIKCPQLQVFLHRKREDKCPTDTEYLMVTPSTFGKVEVHDISVEEPDIIIEFRDCAMDLVGHLRINVYEPAPKALFINWRDVKEMVIEDIKSYINDNDLLELDY